MKQKAILCDIDGVLLDTEHIFDRVIETGLADGELWDYFNRHANDHDVMADYRVIEILEAFAKQGFKIIFLTARNIVIESETKAKIDMSIGQYANEIFKYMLLMRPHRNMDDSDKVKERWLTMLREQYDIFCAIDDDPKNCEMYARNKVLTMQIHK